MNKKVYFDLNYKELNNSIINYAKSKKIFNENLRDMYLSFNNIDFAWNDSNSLKYSETLKKDRIEIIDYFEKIDNLYKEIQIFKTDIENISLKYFNKNDFSKIKYNDSKIVICKNKLNQIYEYILDAQNYINNCNFDNNFSVMYQVNVLKKTIDNMKQDIKNIITVLTSLQSNVNNLVLNNKISIEKLSDITLNISPLKYEWKVSEFNLKE